ncbi:S8 family serine peptidase [Streptomyces sp. NPDC026665]|uniref:S8 family serine peptidase n=1 Tax=Streptomyces sp. NPDC026665 TaxID=3154798 RepID=UPI0033C25D58
MAHIRLTAAIATGLMLVAGGIPSASGQTPQDTEPRSVGDQGASAVTVRLLTGDRVTVTQGTDGRRIASVEPGPGREAITFRTFEKDDGSLTVLPSDAADLVAAGTLDRRLFDVTTLIAQGYDETRTSDLPLIVSAAPQTGVAKVTWQSTKLAAAIADRVAEFSVPSTPERRLDSINAQSLRVAKDDLGAFWKTLHPSGPSGSARVAATPRVWLDGKVAAVLDRSTAQISAPALWKAGYEGRGVKVAVLDTGADANHPDLAGRIAKAKNFSDSATTEDHVGHGTHVASIVGGTGAASSGTRRGVAPRADLLVGKVLGDDGYGTESAIVDGMEWAVGEHAKIVNMSLGSDAPPEGTSPMTEAVNRLSASGETLFVVAAGNSGPARSSIGSPGDADTALTVGAVDRDESLASFSSRGPRLGDKAVKPDVTAPGVGIVAARASGTTMGTPVDTNYTALSGTSMAAPHVAGSAALLAQQHPNWNAQQLKDALISTAYTVPGTKVTAQGGGRIDLTAATGPVTATGTVTLPAIQTDGTGSRQLAATVRYTNSSDHPITISLTMALATVDDRALPPGVVTLDSSRVHIAARATAEVSLRTNATRSVRGAFYGYVTATGTDGAIVAHTTVSLIVHAPLHKLTVVARDHEGRVIQSVAPVIWGADGFAAYTSLEPAVAVVEEGTYQVNYDMLQGDNAYELISPQTKVTKDTTVTLNASKTTEVKLHTPKPAEQRSPITYQTYRRIDGNGLIQGHLYFDGQAQHLYVSPTTRVTDGTFEFASRWQMTAPQLRAKVSGTSSAFTPYYLPASKVFDDKGIKLTAVDAGTGTTADLTAAHVRGKLAVIRYNFGDDYALAKVAADAGAKALMLVMPKDSVLWTRWAPDRERMALPIMRAGSEEGTDLLERAQRRTTTVDFSGTVHSPYLYDIMQVSKTRIPEHLVYTVSDHESAVVRANYTRTGASAWASEQRFGWRPYQETAWNQYSRDVPVGRQRIEYVTAGDTLWSHTVHHNILSAGVGSLMSGNTQSSSTEPQNLVRTLDDGKLAGMRDAPRTYKTGQRVTEHWFTAPVRPLIPRGIAGWNASVRNGDTLSLHIPEFADSAPGHWSLAEVGLGDIGAQASETRDVTHAELYRNGQRIALSNLGAWGDFEVPAGKAGYRLDLTTARTSDDWRFSTATSTSWTFHSDTTARRTLLPLLQVDWRVPVDLSNAVGAQRKHTLGLDVRTQDGQAAPRVVALSLDASYDDGRTWHPARTVPHGATHFTATVERAAGVRADAYVSLRVTAVDAAGNTVRQTVDHAYLHRGPSSGR